jgi:hypothetical protein
MLQTMYGGIYFEVVTEVNNISASIILVLILITCNCSYYYVNFHSIACHQLKGVLIFITFHVGRQSSIPDVKYICDTRYFM